MTDPLAPRGAPIARRRLLAGAIASALASLAGCGGGSISIGGVGTGGTGAFSRGTIRGFASILVGDVHYDERDARITDDAGAPLRAGDLRLGMVVDVDAAPIERDGAGRARARALSVSVRSEIKGPVSAIDRARGVFTVLDQEVGVVATTVFDDRLPAALASLAVGQIVEVCGHLQRAGEYRATRIDLAPADTRRYKLRGQIAALDMTARRFRIGAALISFATVGGNLSGLANGQWARVELDSRPDVAGVWAAREIELAHAAIGVPSSGSVEAEIEGCITAMTDRAHFSVGAVAVDASRVARLPAGLALGQLVEVEGVLSGGVLLAESVEIEDDDDDAFEIEGAISSISPGTRRFVLRGVTVDYASARFEDGRAEDLAVGVTVEVEGRLSADGSTLLALSVEFND